MEAVRHHRDGSPVPERSHKMIRTFQIITLILAINTIGAFAADRPVNPEIVSPPMRSTSENLLLGTYSTITDKNSAVILNLKNIGKDSLLTFSHDQFKGMHTYPSAKNFKLVSDTTLMREDGSSARTILLVDSESGRSDNREHILRYVITAQPERLNSKTGVLLISRSIHHDLSLSWLKGSYEVLYHKKFSFTEQQNNANKPE